MDYFIDGEKTFVDPELEAAAQEHAEHNGRSEPNEADYEAADAYLESMAIIQAERRNEIALYGDYVVLS